MPVIELPVRTQTRRRVQHRLPVVIALWVCCILGTAWVASATRVGPVVYTFTRQRGIHLADVALAALAVVGASVATWFLLRPASRSGAGRDTDPDVEVVAVELRRIPAIIALWIVAVVLAVWVTFETMIGPVLFVYNVHRSVRLGDLVCAAAIVAVAGWVTARLLQPDPEDAGPG